LSPNEWNDWIINTSASAFTIPLRSYNARPSLTRAPYGMRDSPTSFATATPAARPWLVDTGACASSSAGLPWPQNETAWDEDTDEPPPTTPRCRSASQ
jgi:hypothetical protein